MEEKLDCGKPDIIFNDEDGNLVVVEIKRSDNDDSVNQLKNISRNSKAKENKT